MGRIATPALTANIGKWRFFFVPIEGSYGKPPLATFPFCKNSRCYRGKRCWMRWTP